MSTSSKRVAVASAGFTPSAPVVGSRQPEALFQLSLLGHFNLSGPNGPVDLGNKKLCALIAFVACATSEPPSRETLTTLLWGSHFEVQARHNMRQALTRLRRAFGDDVFVNSDNTLVIRPGLFHCDVTSFETLIHDESRQTRKAAVDLYQGTFLANIAIPEEAWTDWLTAQRQRLEDLVVDGLIRLGEEEEQIDAPALALEFANRAIAINGLREDGHRLIMRSLAAVGRRAEALRHYDQLATRLKRDLSVEPDAATTSLVATLRQSRAPRAEPGPAQDPQSPVAAPVEGMPTARAEAPWNGTGVANAMAVAPAQREVRAAGIVAEILPAVSPTQSQQGTLPSIAVLPFQNLGGDPSDDDFADGIVEDIVVSLASLRELVVISRTSTVAYRGRQVDPREVGRALGVRYVLEGSVRKGTASVRVAIQLCDTETGASLWAERHEAPLGDLFEVQDSIVCNVVAGIAPNVRSTELERALRIRPTSFTAYDHTLYALNLINSLDRKTFLSARDHLDKAMAAHPGFAMPVAWAARWYSIWIGQGWSDNPKADADKAAALAARAIDLDGHNALALATYGHVRSFLFHDYDSALVYFDRALSACPNYSLAWILSSATLSYVGRGADAVRHAERGLRLSPYDRSLFLYYNFLGIAHYGNGNYEEAIKWGRLSAAESPLFASNLRMLAAALAAVDRLNEAREIAAALLTLEPNFSLDTYEQTRQPFRQPEIKTRLIAHLRTAGLPA
ncbi:BTAD domain-containing putative transcriptional regulator [Reyranella sp. CPCC 100927]|uniref:BTAD domain-containing putative transcriptional regulator n=1 Tax=Reyranella sp. CPCC 100927 TaxID=2599616 RepID=UPI0015B5436C|nr:BTAD domain-containing putative transcriptional regulator [Reyranella sp. CPCC 100927]